MIVDEIYDIKLGTNNIDALYHQGIMIWPLVPYDCDPYIVPADTSYYNYNSPILSGCYVDAENVKAISFYDAIYDDSERFPNVTSPVLKLTDAVEDVNLIADDIDYICIRDTLVTRKDVTGDASVRVYPTTLKSFTLNGKSKIKALTFAGSGVKYVSMLNTELVTDMSDVFMQCNNLIRVPLFNTSRVTDMSRMFYQCGKLKKVPVFDTNSVAIMSNMFAFCSSLQTVPLFDTRYVNLMRGMFRSCTSLETVPLFDTSNVTSVEEMFIGCINLKNIPLFDTRNVTTIQGFLCDCQNLQELPLLNTSNVVDAADAFEYCTSLETFPALDLSKVENCRYMFNTCTNLKTVPLLDFSNVKVCEGIFEYCNSLENLQGFLNFGKNFTYAMSIDLSWSKNLTQESILNIFNNLYDMDSNVNNVTTSSIYFNYFMNIPDEYIAIATNKGWQIGYRMRS